MRRILPVVLLGAAAACGNPDTIVYGGVGGHGTVPPAVFNSVESALHAIATVTDQNGKTYKRAVVVLTDRSDVCRKVTDKPDYLLHPTEPLVSLVMASPVGASGSAQIGTFIFGQANDFDAVLGVSSGPNGVQEFYPGVVGDESLTALPAGGDGQGSFNLNVIEVGGQTAFAVYGRFKSHPCGALANATIPIIR